MPVYERILIIKPSSLGDVVHALPTLSALRKRFPDAWIAWVIKQEWAEVLAGHPDLNDIIAVDFRLSQWPSLVKQIRRLSCDLAIDLQGLFRTGLLSRLSGARERVGFADAREGSPFFYTQRVALPNPNHKPWRLLDVHAVDRNLTIARHLGADVTRPRFVLPSVPQHEEAVDRWFGETGGNPGERLVALAPVSRLAIKNWPFDRFLETAVALSVQEHCRIVLMGSESQEWMVKPFQNILGNQLVNLVGKAHVCHLSVVLRRVHLLISNDSAALHVASAVETPVLGLFGPTNPLATGPYGNREQNVLKAPLSCSPCGKRTCRNPQYMECLDSITVEQVTERALFMLRNQTQKQYLHS